VLVFTEKKLSFLSMYLCVQRYFLIVLDYFIPLPFYYLKSKKIFLFCIDGTETLAKQVILP